jgi:hypothetical protein
MHAQAFDENIFVDKKTKFFNINEYKNIQTYTKETF